MCYFLYGGLVMLFGDFVKISTPFGVMPIVCSNCADNPPSMVRAVQSLDSIYISYEPVFIIGSIVKTIPSCNMIL